MGLGGLWKKAEYARENMNTPLSSVFFYPTDLLNLEHLIAVPRNVVALLRRYYLLMCVLVDVFPSEGVTDQMKVPCEAGKVPCEAGIPAITLAS